MEHTVQPQAAIDVDNTMRAAAVIGVDMMIEFLSGHVPEKTLERAKASCERVINGKTF